MNNLINYYLGLLKKEVKYNKILKKEVIDKMFLIYNNNYKKMEYLNNIVENPINAALNFYNNFNKDYYRIIINGIKNNKINFYSDHNGFDTINNICNINLLKNDCDVFMIVHELAHYIDMNSYPKILGEKYHFLCEVFSMYIEKQLELFLDNSYSDVINKRINNRLYFEENMLKIIKLELYYENLYNLDNINLNEKDINNIKRIIRTYNNNIVNFLLRYPLGNVLSNYLINNPSIDVNKNLAFELLNVNINNALDDFKLKMNK